MLPALPAQPSSTSVKRSSCVGRGPCAEKCAERNYTPLSAAIDKRPSASVGDLGDATVGTGLSPTACLGTIGDTLDATCDPLGTTGDEKPMGLDAMAPSLAEGLLAPCRLRPADAKTPGFGDGTPLVLTGERGGPMVGTAAHSAGWTPVVLYHRGDLADPQTIYV